MLPIVDILKAHQYADIEYSPNKEFRGSFYQSGKGNVRIPPAPNSVLGHAQRYLVLQVHLRAPHPFMFTIRVRDDRGNIWTFAYSTEKTKSPDRPSSAQFSRMLSFDIPLKTWAIVYFDLEELVREYCAPGTFQNLQTIEMKKFATIGKIFAVDSPPGRELPPELCLPPGIESQTVLFPRGEVMRSPDPTPPGSPIRCSSPRGLVLPSLSPPRQAASPKGSPTTPTRNHLAKRPSEGETLPPPGTVIGEPIVVQPFARKTESRRRPQARRGRVAALPASQRPRPAAPEPREEEDISDEDFFAGEAPTFDPGNEDDLDLVFIQALNCYYCPANQQYYDIDPDDA
jgi:hypothetical protein